MRQQTQNKIWGGGGGYYCATTCDNKHKTRSGGEGVVIIVLRRARTNTKQDLGGEGVVMIVRLTLNYKRDPHVHPLGNPNVESGSQVEGFNLRCYGSTKPYVSPGASDLPDFQFLALGCGRGIALGFWGPKFWVGV